MRLSLDLGLGSVALMGGAIAGDPILSLDFANDTYTEDGAVIASPLALTRADTVWRTAADGVTVTAFTANVARRDSRGLYLERARSRLTTYPTDQVNWSIVGTASRAADTAIGLLTPVIIGSSGSTASMLSSNTNISLTNATSYFVTAVYKAGTSGRARFRAQQAAIQSTVTGVVGAMVVADSAAGAWSNIVNADLSGWYKFDATFTAGATGTDYRLREGPDTANSGETAIFAWSQIVTLPGEIILGNLTIPVSVVQDEASIDVSSFPPTGVVVKFTADRFVTAATILNLEDALGTSTMVLATGTNGATTATLSIAGVQVATISLATLNAREEYTIGLEWRSNRLTGYVNGGVLVTDDFVGTMPDITLAELFPAGGSNITIPELNFYDRPI